MTISDDLCVSICNMDLVWPRACNPLCSRPPGSPGAPALTGRRFDGHGTFVGTVVSYSKEKKFFSVKYSDGDTEELATDTLRGLMGMPPRNQK